MNTLFQNIIYKCLTRFNKMTNENKPTIHVHRGYYYKLPVEAFLVCPNKFAPHCQYLDDILVLETSLLVAQMDIYKINKHHYKIIIYIVV